VHAAMIVCPLIQIVLSIMTDDMLVEAFGVVSADAAKSVTRDDIISFSAQMNRAISSAVVTRLLSGEG
jgi:hypothetical protein